MNGKQGFTLVEILFVVIIAAGILAFAVPAYKRSQVYSEYQAATGLLMSIGNAVQSASADAGAFPQSTEKEITGSENVSAPDSKSKTITGYLGTTTGSARDTLFVQALFEYGYLHPFKTSSPGYKFYAVKDNASEVCSGACKVENSVACMCYESITDVCYYGAVYLSDGTIVRKPKDASKCS